MAKKPKYKLEAYLNHVKQKKEEVQGRLSEAEGKVCEERQVLSGLRTKLDQIEQDKEKRQKEYWEGLREGELAASDIQSRKSHLESIESRHREERMKYLAQERAVQRAERALAKVREELQEISNEVNVHEELKEKWLRELKREMEKKEQRTMDEISSVLYEKKRRERNQR